MPGTALAAMAECHGTDKARYGMIYERFLAPLRARPCRLLEIGIGGYDDPAAGGGSLRMWEEYLPFSRIVGLDYHDKSAHAQGRVSVYRGSQENEALLRSIAAADGPFDVVIDDGSHVSAHVVASFGVLFPLLAPGGVYFVEDVGTSYWPEFGGSCDPAEVSTSMSFFKRLADGLQAASFRGAYERSYADIHASSVSFHPNMVVVEKRG